MYSGYTCYDAGPSSTIAFDFASDSLRVGGMRGGWEGPHSPLLLFWAPDNESCDLQVENFRKTLWELSNRHFQLFSDDFVWGFYKGF